MLALVACAALFVVSCDKDDDNDGASGGKVPTSVTELSYDNGKFDQGHKFEYTYDNSNRLTTSVRSGIDSTGAVVGSVTNVVYSYTGDKLTKMVSTYSYESDNGTTTCTIEYPNDAEVRVSYAYSDESRDTTVYEVNSKGQVVKEGITSYTYAADGTLTEWGWSDNTEARSGEYEYDSKNGVYKNWNMPEWYMLEDYHYNMIHNMTSAKWSDANNGDTLDRTYTYTMKYDGDDYPTEITEMQNGVVQGVQTIVYK